MENFITLIPDDCYEKQYTIRIIERLINGDDLTVSWKYKECHINKWRDSPEKIPNNIAQFLINTGIVDEDSGNIETCERHFTFKSGQIYPLLVSRFGKSKKQSSPQTDLTSPTKM